MKIISATYLTSQLPKGKNGANERLTKDLTGKSEAGKKLKRKHLRNETSIGGVEKLQYIPGNLEGHIHAGLCTCPGKGLRRV